MHLLTIPPGACAPRRICTRRHETALYMLSGEAVTFGTVSDLEQPGGHRSRRRAVLHSRPACRICLPISVSTRHAPRSIARTDPNEQESVVLPSGFGCGGADPRS